MGVVLQLSRVQPTIYKTNVKIFLLIILKVALHTFYRSRKSWTALKSRVLALRCGVEFCFSKLMIRLRFMYKKILRSYKKKLFLKKVLKKKKIVWGSTAGVSLSLTF